MRKNLGIRAGFSRLDQPTPRALPGRLLRHSSLSEAPFPRLQTQGLRTPPFQMTVRIQLEQGLTWGLTPLPFNHRRRRWHPTPVLLPRKSNGWRSLVGCSPWGREGSDTTERLHFHFSLSCIGEGNGNPLQCSCLENPRDGGAWWAAVYGVAQSRTRLKRLSSSSSLQSHCMGSLEKCTLAPDNSEQRVCLKLVTNEGQLYK